MRMREGLPYMLAGGAMVVAYMIMRNGNMKHMFDNAMKSIKNKSMNGLEDMM